MTDIISHDTQQLLERALAEIAERLVEAIERGLWVPRSNSARARIEGLRDPKLKGGR